MKKTICYEVLMLFLIRHAHSSWTSDEMRPLSLAGRAEAERVADILEPLAIKTIHSSPYTRAIQTVQPLSGRLDIPIQIEPTLRERRLTLGYLEDVENAVEATWRDFDLAYPGGESSRVAQTRFTGAILKIAQAARDENAVVSAHGQVVSLFLHGLDSTFGFETWGQMSMPDIYAIDTSAELWTFSRLWSSSS